MPSRWAVAESSTLTDTVRNWVTISDRVRASGALSPARPLPAELLAARSSFELAWHNTGLSGRRAADEALLGRALALAVRSYRFQENGNPQQIQSIAWADEAIGFYGQVANRRQLAEALLEKAAIFLDVSQLHHTDRGRFEQLSQEGDRLLQECMDVASDDQRPEVLRIWSRFYYNLARPASGRLSDRWDQKYLVLAGMRIDEALRLQPNELRNLNQKARTVQRQARNTLDAPYESWSNELWKIQRQFDEAWKLASPRTTRAVERRSPLNVLAMVTLDAIVYNLAVSDDPGRRNLAPVGLKILDETALPAQLEAWALVRNTELRREYGFDTAYDLARLYALRGVLAGIMKSPRQDEAIDHVVRHLGDAREAGTVPQLDAARASITLDPVFADLPDFVRQRLLRKLNGQPD